MKTAELINGDSLNRRLNAQTDGALSPIRLKQNYQPAHHYPEIIFCKLNSGLKLKCQLNSGLNKNCQLFLGRYNEKCKRFFERQ